MEFNNLLEELNLKFKDPKILKQVFYHRSYLNEVKTVLESNERLEFLGDSILSLVVSFYLFQTRPKDTEGELTNLRAYVVKTKSLAQAAQKLNLGSLLYLSKGEEQGGGRENPQLLANTYEALLGAVYLDSGLEAVKTVIEKTLLPLFANELKSGPPKDAKSSLQEIVQEKYKQSPNYKILETKGPDHAKKFLVAVYIKGKEYGRGGGNSKQVAEEESATEALSRLT
ncbi:ribonuclease III [Candidatus Daviesbacteria bacterium RIFCSPHIGHO2_02_FULL_36_13]|uniref:Ribonuclease 3 n=1 Tax=Candidatus Daviesbacteria bacterium RIFCSPHIGHO2_02_FULL_36_13 TaxID=1797768 RepID=A0A1F5JPT2_9BACT|nr:MAG: ribonuclease III [Candidatus Daviesbacteria bacterium RIFCSPHIGHO2_02_FULL_36_13]OGE44654.1 MAG: ribonuclease III [Candidatus Daviesbacteria bacterium RIFCSPLOWO2_01_FULL_36_8]